MAAVSGSQRIWTWQGLATDCGLPSSYFCNCSYTTAQAQPEWPKSLRVEALLAAAAPAPPPCWDPVLDPARLGTAWPEDLPALLALLPRADLYLQDEVEVALHPTLTRVWCRRGRLGQRKVQAPGTNAKRSGFGLVDWRTGWFDWSWPRGAGPRRSVPRSAGRSPARGPVAGSRSSSWTT